MRAHDQLQREARRVHVPCLLGRALLGPQMKFLEAPKGLEAQRAMAGVSLAAMAGVTAADHERISKFCRVTSWSWV